MYKVTIYNNGVPIEIQNESRKLRSGSVVKGINTIDSFTFSLLPNNIGFDRINDKTTLVEVYNTHKNRYEFRGRVLYSSPAMDSNGLITKEFVCESYFGFLCDSEQTYVEEQNWTVLGLLEHIINTHNSQIEDYKEFTIGTVTVTDPNDNLYLGIQRKNTWETIKEKLLDKLGGELRFRVTDGILYIDYISELGGLRATEIALSRNMKSITQENDPTAYVSRLIPLGSKLTREETFTDDEGNTTTETVETEERLDITAVNNGINYIVDYEAQGVYGINVKSVIFDDVTEPRNLLSKGQQWLRDNNKVRIKYSVDALDLSRLGLDIDDFNVHDSYPVKNSLLGINDTARVIKKTIDLVKETSSKIELGDSFKSLSDIQQEQADRLDDIDGAVEKIESDYTTNAIMQRLEFSSLIQQTAQSIMLTVKEDYESSLESVRQQIESELELLADQMSLRFTETMETIENVNGELSTRLNTITTYFTFDINGLTIGKVDNPNKVKISNEKIIIEVSGVAVQEFDANGNAFIPKLNVEQSLNLLGLLIDTEGNNINCEYIGG